MAEPKAFSIISFEALKEPYKALKEPYKPLKEPYKAL